MYETHAEIDTPAHDTVLWRYMNLEKLLSLLSSNSLYCCRLDRLRDPWEGIWPRPVRESLQRSMTSLGLQPDFSGMDFGLWRTSIFVNCWHESTYQSAALWDQYANSAGLAIRSTVERLIKASGSGPRFFIGRVKYLDYEREAPRMKSPLLNQLVPAFLKRKSFEHEREVRALVLDAPIRDHKIDLASARESQAIPVDLKVLVESIFLSPQSPSWVVGHIEELLRRFDLAAVTVRRSDLYDERVF